jgi:hydrogenase nickel incorporation protein HypA/HybF
MHETHLTRDLVHKLEEISVAEHGARITRIGVRLGALSHFTPEHFREHFVDAAAGTCAEGAVVDAELVDDPYSPAAQDVVLETVEVEIKEPS